MDFNFFMPTRVFSGEDALMKNSASLAELGQRCLIVCGGSSAKLSGALADAEKALSSIGVAHRVFDKIGPNPLTSVCHLAGEKARAFGADFILGIGGGSPLDAAKAVALYASNPQIAAGDIFTKKPENPPLTLALIGTTAGTGSEVTGVSVLTIAESGRKKSVSGPNFYADISFADPKYTYSVPYDTTASTALDAFSHALESFFTPKCVGLTKCIAQKALVTLWPALKSLAESEELPAAEIRDSLYYGSLYAGLAINTTGTAFPHPLGYVLTENFGLPHGKACAAFMPAFLQRAHDFAPELYGELFDLLKTDLRELSETVKKLLNKPGIKINRQEAEEYAQRWAEQLPGNFLVSPGGLDFESAKEILATINL